MFEVQKDDFLAKKKQYFKPDTSSLRTGDIEGAQPYLPGYKYTNKPNYYMVDDIEKASPQPRHRSSNKPSTNLLTSDIPNANPNVLQFKTSRKDHNPLTPLYNLPTFEVKPSTPPRFIRDSINIDDIEGCRPSVYSKWQTRNSTDIKDIFGATAKPKRNLNKPDLMNPRDINTIEVFESKRVTNPLMPEYLCRNEDNQVVLIGDVEGSRPRRMVNLKQVPHSRHLSTGDIEGATAGTKGNGPIGTKLRNYLRGPNETTDIEGAQAGTFKKGISTVRATNPLDPSYTWMTEDPADIPPKPAQSLTNDKFFAKNTARFWGASSTHTSRTASSRSSSIPPATPGDLQLNAKKFFGHESATPKTLEKAFEKNASKFYESQGKPVQSYLPVGSINRPKVQSKVVDMDAESYQDNARKFFYAGTPTSPGRLSVDLNKEVRGGGGTGSGSQASSKRTESEYQFALSRSEIGRPEVKAGTSQKKSLSNAGKSFISS